MNHLFHQSAAWYQALTLSERIALLRTREVRTEAAEASDGLRERRFRRWASQPPFNSGNYFEERLATDGLNPDELRQILGEPPLALRDRVSSTPPWLSEILTAYSEDAERDQDSIGGKIPNQEFNGFLSLIEPLIGRGRLRLREAIQALGQQRSDLPFDVESVEELFVQSLVTQLFGPLGRTMVLELNVARLNGLLMGDTAQERFECFIRTKRKPEEAVALLEEYPVLARQLIIRIDNWVNVSLEFLTHLCGDWDIICKVFSPQEKPGRLREVQPAAGDLHRKGRSVIIASFDSGLKIVYKPRALTADIHFQRLLTWLNDLGDHPPFKTLQVIDKGSYGWVEFVLARGCESPNEINRFYQRFGGYLAVLYSLQAADFHFENLIACGEHPVLIDLESLFHPYLGPLESGKSESLAQELFSRSVLRVGLLPQLIRFKAGEEGIDVSGLGGKPGEQTLVEVPSLEKEGTDQMRIGRRQVELRGGQNRPSINGIEVNPIDYQEEIIRGFDSVYHTILKERDALLSDAGPLKNFSEAEVRILLRPTKIYGQLLTESFHPDLLRNALDRDRFLDKLWVGVVRSPHLLSVIKEEREDLQNGDIPIFSTCPISKNLRTSTNKVIADFFAEPAMDFVRGHISQLSEADFNKQVWFIRASMTSLITQGDSGGWPRYESVEPSTVIDHEQLILAAQRVGDRLSELALRGENGAEWLGVNLVKENRWGISPLGMDLYSGVPGVALFLAYLGEITKQDKYSELAKAAVVTIERQLELFNRNFTLVGAFTGWSGVIYALTHLGVLWADPRLLDRAAELVRLLEPLIERDEELDIIGGSAGCIAALLSCHPFLNSSKTLSVAQSCGEKLISSARTMSEGVGWVKRNAGDIPLIGFSHGVAGIAWALLRLADVTGTPEFRETAWKSVAYERAFYSPEAQNWPDLRYSSGGDQQVFTTEWCSGACGVGLSRLYLLSKFPDEQTNFEVKTALKTVLAQGFGQNHSLCHGDLGNLEFLLQAAQTLNGHCLESEIKCVSSKVVESINRWGWISGVPSGIETPGLMTGLAGIGYGLMRLAEPSSVPSVLTLDPPCVDA